MDVLYTTSLVGNYYVPGGVPAVESVSPLTPPNSLLFESEPAFFTDAGVDWPPVTPGLVTEVYSIIPAGVRFLAGEGPDETAPTLTTATIEANGTTLTLHHNEAVAIGAGGNGGFTVMLSGGAATLTYSSTVGSNIIYTFSRPVLDNETGSLDYDQPGDGVEDAAGNDLAPIVSKSVVNNSSQSASPATGTTTVNSSASGSTSVSGSGSTTIAQ